jgi:acetyl esterase/lipase
MIDVGKNDSMDDAIVRTSGLMYDPALDEYVPEIRKLNELAGPMLADALAILDPVKLAAARKRSADQDALVRRDDFEDRFIDGPAGPLRVRVKSPTSPSAVLIDIHGGAFSMGSPDGGDPLNNAYVGRANVAVVSVDYRLAPEHPYPAGADDCEAAALWVMQRAKAEWGTDRVMITGTSAGGNLAAVTLLRLRDRHDALANVIGANLVHDDALEGGRKRRRTRDLPGMLARLHRVPVCDGERSQPTNDLVDAGAGG